MESVCGRVETKKSSRKEETEEKLQLETLEERNQGRRSGHVVANEEKSLAVYLNLKLSSYPNLLTLT